MMAGMSMLRLAPSLLAADQTNLQAAVDACAAAGIQVLHLDVMDGHYVPNLTFGPKVAVDLARYITARGYEMHLDVHLMVTDPDRFVPAFAEAHPAWITIHAEAPMHPLRTLQLIRDHGCGAGISLNPGTPLPALEELLDITDLILLMSVNPGFAGQRFIESSLDKIARCRALLERRQSSAILEVDGGIGVANLPQVVAAGARMLVVGNAAFDEREGRNMTGNLAALQTSLRQCQI